MVRCNEMEIELAETESELMKACYATEFEVNGLATLSAFLKASVKSVEDALCHQRNKQNEVVAKIDSKRDGFIISCHDFQWKIQADQTIMALSSQKESLEYEYELLIRKENALSLSMSAFVEDVLEELRSSLSVLEFEVLSKEDENKKILQDIDDLKATLLFTFAAS
uniref:Uncharacterized protein n=1 Tax=Kalanchoe fedtschenkoi TaxID=63787 RepID=A0A7N0UGR4_KALFE